MIKISMLLYQMLSRITMTPQTCKGCPHHVPECDKEQYRPDCYFVREVNYMRKALDDLEWGLSDET